VITGTGFLVIAQRVSHGDHHALCHKKAKIVAATRAKLC
jgi:hypothetical protein